MHAEKMFANSRPLFSLPAVLYKMALQPKGFLTQLCLVMPINRSLFWAQVSLQYHLVSDLRIPHIYQVI